ncbi:MAG: DedA family protein [Selenomonadaceae bacterium]|nr:DedA family protein [Selenomonadaceae bacterium]
MEQLQQSFLDFISVYGYFAVALLMAMENACIPIPSELILGFAGYLIFADQMTFTGAMTAGMIGGMVGSIFAYAVGSYGGRTFVDKYGKYFLIKKSHVDLAQRWFDKYGIRAVFFSRMLPVVRTFISLPAGFARVNFKAFLFYTFVGSLPWTALILYLGILFGENWKKLLELGHEASIIVVIAILIIVAIYIYKKRKNSR